MANIEQKNRTASDGDMRAWEQAASGAIEIEGYSQYGGAENDRTLDALIGVPLIVIHVTFRRGGIIPEGLDIPRDYVSCECMVHPDYLSRFPRMYVVFNDGSTGIYRQIVAALYARDFIELNSELPETGEAHATRYDVSFTSDDNEAVEFRDIKILCPEGLRKSEYDNPRSSSGKARSVTWYLA